MLIPLLCLLAGLLIGSFLIVIGIRRWLSGKPFPTGLGLVSAVIAAGGWILAKATGTSGAGLALLLGLTSGCMLANVWAVRAARANRPPTPR